LDRKKKAHKGGKLKAAGVPQVLRFYPHVMKTRERKERKQKPFLQKPKCHLFNFKNSVTHQSFGDVLFVSCWAKIVGLCFGFCALFVLGIGFWFLSFFFSSFDDDDIHVEHLEQPSATFPNCWPCPCHHSANQV